MTGIFDETSERDLLISLGSRVAEGTISEKTALNMAKIFEIAKQSNTEKEN